MIELANAQKTDTNPTDPTTNLAFLQALDSSPQDLLVQVHRLTTEAVEAEAGCVSGACFV